MKLREAYAEIDTVVIHERRGAPEIKRAEGYGMGGWGLKVLLCESLTRIEKDRLQGFTDPSEIAMYQGMNIHTRSLPEVLAAGALKDVGRFLLFYEKGGLTYPSK